MQIIFLTTLTMIAFAANSVLNRMGLTQAGMDPVQFGTVRLFAGAVTLVVLALILRRGLRVWGPGRLVSVLSLLLYIYGFSIAYVVLDAGLGALILLGTVQITMFVGALLQRIQQDKCTSWSKTAQIDICWSLETVGSKLVRLPIDTR